MSASPGKRPLHSNHSSLSDLSSLDEFKLKPSINRFDSTSSFQSMESISKIITADHENYDNDCDTKLDVLSNESEVINIEKSEERFSYISQDSTPNAILNPLHYGDDKSSRPRSESKSNKLKYQSKMKKINIPMHPRARSVVNRAKNVGQQGLLQAKIAGV